MTQRPRIPAPQVPQAAAHRIPVSVTDKVPAVQSYLQEVPRFVLLNVSSDGHFCLGPMPLERWNLCAVLAKIEVEGQPWLYHLQQGGLFADCYRASHSLGRIVPLGRPYHVPNDAELFDLWIAADLQLTGYRINECFYIVRYAQHSKPSKLRPRSPRA